MQRLLCGLETLFLHAYFGTRPVTKGGMNIRDGGGRRRRWYLDTARGHSKFFGQFLAESGVGLCVVLVDVLEDFELAPSCPLSMFDLVGLVGEEGSHVDLTRIHSWGDEGGNAGG